MTSPVHVEGLHLDVIGRARLQVVQDVAVCPFPEDGQVAVVSGRAGLPEQDEVPGDVLLGRRVLWQHPVDAQRGVADVEDLRDERNDLGRGLQLRFHLEPWRELALTAVVVVKHCAHFEPKIQVHISIL